MTREEAIIELKKKITCTIGGLSKEEYNATVMAIEALQREEAEEKGYCHRIRPKGEWIEAEPSTSDHVLVTYRWGDDDYEVSELDYGITKYEAENGNAQCKRLIDHVIAWRYMPAPYKDGDSE